MPSSIRLSIDTSVLSKLIRVVNLTARPFHASVGKGHQLSLNEWRVMVVIGSHPKCTATDVASFTGLDKMSVSRALAGLEKHGRLKRSANPADQRSSTLLLTPVGKRLFEKISKLAAQREAILLSGLDAGELDRLGNTLDKLIIQLNATDTDAEAVASKSASKTE